MKWVAVSLVAMALLPGAFKYQLQRSGAFI
jgi:hypothetical protein